MHLIAGLGNPGPRYASTRHNVGFMTVERIADRSAAAWCVRPRARVAEAHIRGRDVLLIEPQTYMNCSGEILAAALRDYEPEALVVVYDDVDLSLGRLRVRRGGGAGGHRGVASVIDLCGPEFTRVRLGVGRPPEGIETADFVLSPLEEAVRVALAETVDCAADAVECLVGDGVEVAMNRFNAEAAEAEGL